MIIDLKKIKDEQELRVSHEYDPIRCETEFDDWHYVEPVHLSAAVHRQNDVLDIKGILTSRCRITCSRCLKELEVPIEEEVDLCFEIANKHELDITDEIREQLIFLHTQQLLCSDDCQGLCPYCGQDRNTTPCSCSPDAIKPGSENGLFGQLNQIKDKLNDIEKEK